MTNALECDDAVEEIESMDSHILCKAVSAPMVRSVIDMSLLSHDISDILDENRTS